MRSARFGILFCRASDDQLFSGASVGNNVIVSCRGGSRRCKTVRVFAPCSRLGDVLEGMQRDGQFGDFDSVVIADCTCRFLRALCSRGPRLGKTLDGKRRCSLGSGIFRGVTRTFDRIRPVSKGQCVHVLKQVGGRHYCGCVQRSCMGGIDGLRSCGIFLPKTANAKRFKRAVTTPFVKLPNSNSARAFVKVKRFRGGRRTSGTMGCVGAGFTHTVCNVLGEARTGAPKG